MTKYSLILAIVLVLQVSCASKRISTLQENEYNYAQIDVPPMFNGDRTFLEFSKWIASQNSYQVEAETDSFSSLFFGIILLSFLRTFRQDIDV